DVEALVMRTLSRDRETRPHDAFAFQDELSELLLRLGPDDPSVHTAVTREAVARTPVPPPAPREPALTEVDGGPFALATREMSVRWMAAVAELEQAALSAHRHGAAPPAAATRAQELAATCREILFRIDR